MRRTRDPRTDLPLMAEINVTSFVDVALTLLVILVITAPVLQGGIEVDLPEAATQPIGAMAAVEAADGRSAIATILLPRDRG
jgi:biopolymer transport protein ExbD